MVSGAKKQSSDVEQAFQSALSKHQDVVVTIDADTLWARVQPTAYDTQFSTTETLTHVMGIQRRKSAFVTWQAVARLLLRRHSSMGRTAPVLLS